VYVYFFTLTMLKQWNFFGNKILQIDKNMFTHNTGKGLTFELQHQKSNRT